LGPHEQPPSSREDAPSARELAAIEELSSRVTHALAQLLERPTTERTKLLDSVWRRGAEVVWDPGWIDVQLSLQEVSIEVRRAGLDLDLGFVPWLGVVVRFVYV
jgi:hypothetical protein